MWFTPGDQLVVDEQFPDASQLADANSEKHRALHRIVVPARSDDKIMLAALLRHELEHARHYDALGQSITRLHDFIERRVLPHKAGALDGCAGQLVNAVPTEIDCNSTASIYVAGRFSEAEVARLRSGPRKALACSLRQPEPFATLPARMLAFAFVHRSAVIAYANAHDWEVDETLDGYFGDGASDLWSRLESGLSP